MKPEHPCDKEGRIVLPRNIELGLRWQVSTGGKVEAIRREARLTGAGPMAAKDYFDNLSRR